MPMKIAPEAINTHMDILILWTLLSSGANNMSKGKFRCLKDGGPCRYIKARKAHCFKMFWRTWV